MVIKCEVAHEAERALCQAYNRWHNCCVVLLGRPKERAIATQRDDVINNRFVSFCEFQVFLRIDVVAKVDSRRTNLIKKVFWHDDVDRYLALLLLLLQVLQKNHQVEED